LWRRPATLDVSQAAALPAVTLTAWFALFELAHPHEGDTVLVHSAAGGVGSALVQLARIAGCRVAGVVGSSHKVETVRALGADVVIDKSREDLWSRAEAFAPRGFDVILDANGVSTLRESERHLAAPGKLVIYGFHSMMGHADKPRWIKLAWDWIRTPRFSPLDLTNRNRSVMAFNLSYLFERKQFLHAGMAELLRWLEEERLKAPTVTEFAFDRVADAHRAIESGRTVGKLVLRV
jgi:NADPH:quinone reductase-like Zn-dependent oxidoreductase